MKNNQWNRLIQGLNLTKLKVSKLPAAVLVLIVVVGFFAAFPPKLHWLGIGDSTNKSLETVETVNGKVTKKTTTTKFDSAKTLWDWMSLILAPLTIAGVGLWFQHTQEQEKIAKERAEKERTEQNLREDALEAYLDSLSHILVEQELTAIEDKKDPVLKVALDVIRARTLSILRRLDTDKERKASVLLFLYDAELLLSEKLFLILNGANFKGANLKKVDLKGADLVAVDLEEADLEEAKLEEANLKKANLKKTKLIGAKLEKAVLKKANLEEADLMGADLKEADLEKADLKGARNLTIKQVKDAKNWETATYDPDFCNQLDITRFNPVDSSVAI